MEILLGLLFGATLGAVLHVLMPGRESRGAALAPVVGAAAGGTIWLILTWAGLGPDNAWIWIASIVLPAVVVPALLTSLTRARANHDAQERLRLKIA